MPKNSCQMIDHLEALATKSLDKWSRRSTNLSRRDHALYIRALFLQCLMLTDLLASRDMVVVKREVSRWFIHMSKTPVLDLCCAIKEWTAWFRNIDQAPTSYTSFKRSFAPAYPFLGQFFAPIRTEVEQFLTTFEAADFFVINQHLSFITRLNLQDVDYVQQSITAWKATEERIGAVDYKPSTLAELNLIMREWLTGFSCDELVPSHGPGAVSGLKKQQSSLIEKYKRLDWDARLGYFLDDQDNPSGYFPLVPGKLDRTAEVVFVAKSALGLRTISKEPASLQYFQQGVKRVLYRWFEVNPSLRAHLFLSNQERMREIAKKASVTRSHATIDLSSASDSVSWQLVKNVFRGTPLLRALYALRSDYAALPDGSTQKLRLFAPMGSALCFPVECLIFAAICEKVARQYPRCKSAYYVYGDDMIVPTEYVSDVIAELESNGFVVNQSKSFSRRCSPFRESCGGEYYDGRDVTPWRISRKFTPYAPSSEEPELWSQYVQLANSASLYGYTRARLWFIRSLFGLE